MTSSRRRGAKANASLGAQAMPSDNVELVLEATLAIAAGVLRFDLLAPGYVWDFSTAPGLWPEEQRHRGRRAVAELLRSWIGVWEELRLEVEEAIDGGDCVIVVTRSIGRLSGSHARVEGRWAYLTTCRGGLMVRTEVYFTKGEAIEAAGLVGEVLSAS
jgi:ketosteroid isomerase-like protein